MVILSGTTGSTAWGVPVRSPARFGLEDVDEEGEWRTGWFRLRVD